LYRAAVNVYVILVVHWLSASVNNHNDYSDPRCTTARCWDSCSHMASDKSLTCAHTG